MKRFLKLLVFASGISMLGSIGAFAQGNVKSGPDSATIRDSELERDSLNNLEKARFYFTTRKAYEASLARCLETIAGDPTFSKIDEVLYIAGESSYRLSIGKGKQKPKDSVAQLRLDAREYLSKLVKEFPESKFRKSAEEDLKALNDGGK